MFKKCPNCGVKTSHTSECPTCGYEFDEEEKEKRNREKSRMLDEEKESTDEEKGEVFSIRSSVASDAVPLTHNLNNKDIPRRLKDEFKKKGYPLSNDKHISVKVVNKSSKWKLYDEMNGYIYRIKKENDKLKIYGIQKVEELGTDKQYLFSFRRDTKDVVENLNDEDTPIWEPLKDKYEEEGYPLSNNEHISVKVVKSSKAWELYDEIKGYNHRIIKEKGNLNVYKLEKSKKVKEEKRKADKETGEELEVFNKVKVFSLGKNVGLGLLIYILTCFFIGMGLLVFELPIIFLLVPFILSLGVISLVVGSILGLSSENPSDAFLSGSLVSFLGTIIVIVILIFGGVMELQEATNGGFNWGGNGEEGDGDEICGRFFIFSIMMGLIGGISGSLTNKLLLRVSEKRDSS